MPLTLAYTARDGHRVYRDARGDAALIGTAAAVYRAASDPLAGNPLAHGWRVLSRQDGLVLLLRPDLTPADVPDRCRGVWIGPRMLAALAAVATAAAA